MTDTHREAAVEQVARDLYERDSGLPVARCWPSWSSLIAADSPVPAQYRVKARSALTALTDAGFVVLHRDDVTEERQAFVAIPDAWGGDQNCARRFVTRWELITKEDS